MNYLELRMSFELDILPTELRFYTDRPKPNQDFYQVDLKLNELLRQAKLGNQ